MAHQASLAGLEGQSATQAQDATRLTLELQVQGLVRRTAQPPPASAARLSMLLVHLLCYVDSLHVLRLWCEAAVRGLQAHCIDESYFAGGSQHQMPSRGLLSVRLKQDCQGGLDSALNPKRDCRLSLRNATKFTASFSSARQPLRSCRSSYASCRYACIMV